MEIAATPVDLNIFCDNARVDRANAMVKNADSMAGVSDQDQQQVGKLAEEFEAIFLNLVFKSMRNTVPKSELLDGGQAEDVFKDMLDAEYSKHMASQRNTGIADSIAKEMLKTMENQANAMARQIGKQVYSGENLPSGQNREKMLLQKD